MKLKYFELKLIKKNVPGVSLWGMSLSIEKNLIDRSIDPSIHLSIYLSYLLLSIHLYVLILFWILIPIPILSIHLSYLSVYLSIFISFLLFSFFSGWRLARTTDDIEKRSAAQKELTKTERRYLRWTKVPRSSSTAARLFMDVNRLGWWECKVVVRSMKTWVVMEWAPLALPVIFSNAAMLFKVVKVSWGSQLFAAVFWSIETWFGYTWANYRHAPFQPIDTNTMDYARWVIRRTTLGVDVLGVYPESRATLIWYTGCLGWPFNARNQLTWTAFPGSLCPQFQVEWWWMLCSLCTFWEGYVSYVFIPKTAGVCILSGALICPWILLWAWIKAWTDICWWEVGRSHGTSSCSTPPTPNTKASINQYTTRCSEHL